MLCIYADGLPYKCHFGQFECESRNQPSDGGEATPKENIHHIDWRLQISARLPMMVQWYRIKHGFIQPQILPLWTDAKHPLNDRLLSEIVNEVDQATVPERLASVFLNTPVYDLSRGSDNTCLEDDALDDRTQRSSTNSGRSQSKERPSRPSKGYRKLRDI